MFEVGTRVSFSRQWLRATCTVTGWKAFARGSIIGLEAFGHWTDAPMLATVQWDDRSRICGEVGPMHTKVLTTNLEAGL